VVGGGHLRESQGEGRGVRVGWEDQQYSLYGVSLGPRCWDRVSSGRAGEKGSPLQEGEKKKRRSLKGEKITEGMEYEPVSGPALHQRDEGGVGAS